MTLIKDLLEKAESLGIVFSRDAREFLFSIPQLSGNPLTACDPTFVVPGPIEPHPKLSKLHRKQLADGIKSKI